MNQNEVDLIRDTALSIKDKDIEAAYDLMCLAHKYRPQGALIERKMHEFKSELQVDNGKINIHFGVHKTATTYIQEHLELIEDPNFHYTNLDEYRAALKEIGYFNFLKSLDFGKKVVISDENMIGDNGTILTGTLYPKFKSNISRYLRHFRNRELVNVYISIRPMTSFLPSQYCEYLRWNKYISYEKFVSKVNVTQLRWIDTLRDVILSNQDIKFHIFDFNKFAADKNKQLEVLSFGFKSECDERIKPSRVSFTNREISQLSNGEFTSDSDKKFDPHTEEEKALSMANYEKDLAALAEMSNIEMVSSTSVVSTEAGKENKVDKKQKVHFLHIGKTGGSAIKSVLERIPETDKYAITLHSHATTIKDIPRGESIVFFLRDPISRFVSGFYSRQRKGQPRYNSEWSSQEKKVFEHYATPNEIAVSLNKGEEMAYQAMKKVQHFRRYNNWYVDFDYFESRIDDILFVGFQETLDADFAKLKGILGISKESTLPTDDVLAHKNPDNLDKFIEQDGVSALKKWYSEDVMFIEVCKKVMLGKIKTLE
jgi:hypothetical protein